MAQVDVLEHDKLTNFKFIVRVQGFAEAGFNAVSGLADESEVIEYREGTDVDAVRKVPGTASFDDITLSRGVGMTSEIPDWRDEIRDIQATATTPPPDFRKTVDITVRNKGGSDIRTFHVIRAWPSSLEHSDLDAEGNDIMFEDLVLSHEGYAIEHHV